MPVIKKKTVKYLGKRISYTKITDLEKKLKVSREVARKLISEPELNIYIQKYKGKKLGDVEKINVKEVNPHLFREYGIKSFNKIINEKAKVKTGDYIISSDSINVKDNYNRIRYHFNITVTFDISEERVTRQVTAPLVSKYKANLSDLEMVDGVIKEKKPVSSKNMVRIDERQYFDSTIANLGNQVLDYLLNVYRPDEAPKEGFYPNKIEHLNELAEKGLFKIYNAYSKQEFKWTDQKLQDPEPLNIFNQWLNIDENISKENCVKNYLKSQLTRLNKEQKEEIEKMGDDKGVTGNELLEFCKKYKYTIYMYNINGKLMESYIPEKRNKNGKYLNVLAYNGHLYGIKNTYLERRPINIKEKKPVKNIKKMITETLIKKKVVPQKVEVLNNQVISFILDDVEYFHNPEYNKCKKILEKFGIADRVYKTITIKNILKTIDKLYLKDNVDSFMPNCSMFRKGGFNYVNKDINTLGKKITTLDKRRAYTYALSILPYLITCDIRTGKVTKNPKKIVPHYLYIIKQKRTNFLLPNNDLYPGYYLEYCKEKGLEFELLEEIETEKKINYYTQMIEDLYKNVENKNDLKEMMNVYIGKMSKDVEVKETNNVLGIFTPEEAKTMDGYEVKLGKYIVKYEIDNKVENLYNKLPINIQINLEARKVLYEKVIELGISEDNIIQIKTDSISYIGEPPKDLGKEDYTGWKLEEYTPLKNEVVIYEKDISFDDVKSVLVRDENILCNCYAGAGKTYDILNNVIPKIKDKSYIILSPTYVSLEEYRNNDLNCKVIQKYTMTNKIPKEDIIIIDECGMIDKQGHDLIYKMAILGKTIYMYGDFNQLPPVEPENEEEEKIYNSSIYLNLLFKNKRELADNYRNDFTKEYYDSLINSTSKKYLVEQIIKYQSNEPDLIICYRNKRVDYHNNKIMKEKGLNKFSPTLPIICRKNYLMDKDVYNGCTYTIKSYDKKTQILIITDKNNIEYTITKNEYERNFKVAYAMTIHCTQGKSLPKIYYDPEDWNYIDAKKAYVIISRLKTK